MEIKINQAIKLLQENGYIVKKFTKDMIEDANKCEDLAANGESMECIECSCNICIVNN